MVQAACEGMIDYSKADLLDPKWWQKFWLVLDYVGRVATSKSLEYKFAFNLAVLDYRTDQTTLDAHWEAAEHLRTKLCRSIMPWIDTGPEDTKEKLEAMRERYIETWGDPQDPAYQAEMQRLIDHWRNK
jgi:hypothetical protein